MYVCGCMCVSARMQGRVAPTIVKIAESPRQEVTRQRTHPAMEPILVVEMRPRLPRQNLPCNMPQADAKNPRHAATRQQRIYPGEHSHGGGQPTFECKQYILPRMFRNFPRDFGQQQSCCLARAWLKPRRRRPGMTAGAHRLKLRGNIRMIEQNLRLLGAWEHQQNASVDLYCGVRDIYCVASQCDEMRQSDAAAGYKIAFKRRGARQCRHQ